MSKSNDQWWINIHILFITDHLISSFILIIIIHLLNWFLVYNFEPQRHYFQFLIVHLYLSYYTESRSVLTSWKDMLDPKLIFQLWGIIIWWEYMIQNLRIFLNFFHILINVSNNLFYGKLKYSWISSTYICT